MSANTDTNGVEGKPASVRVAVVGAGNMGGGMVGRLRDLDEPVVVCDIDPVRQAQALAFGATLCATPRDAAARLGSDGVLIVCVVDAVQTEDVLLGVNGACQTMSPGQVVLLCPTLGVGDVERMAARVQAQGLACVDAPMSGGPARARTGDMSLMVAGDAKALAACRWLLDLLSTRLFIVGDRAGDGARTKLVNNLLAGINLVGAAEALALAGALGLDVTRTLDVIEQSSGQSWIGTDRMRRILSGDIEPKAHIRLLAKDTGLAMKEVQALGRSGVIGGVAAEAFASALRAGWESEDDAAMLRWVDRLASRSPSDQSLDPEA